MTTEQINSLLVKFYDGGTSAEEEQRLSDFFGSENLPREWEKDRQLFRSLASFSAPAPADLEQRIGSFIHSLEKAEKPAPRIALWVRATAVAASLLLIIGIGLWTQSRQTAETELFVDTFNSPQQAQEAALQALELFSQHFAKGVQPLQKADQRVAQTQEIVLEIVDKWTVNELLVNE